MIEHPAGALPSVRVTGVPVTALCFDQQLGQMLQWAVRRESRVVCVANVHMLMEARRDPEFASLLKQADLVTPDGMPLVWMMRWSGMKAQDRVTGFEILPALCREAAARGLKVFFLGSTPEVLRRIRARLSEEFPSLEVAGMASPPFRPLLEAEDEALVEAINDSGAELVMVSLGCPKQERWMHAHRGRVRAVLVGLGGAFPVFAGVQRRSPRWVQVAGLEWAFRLVQEPRRLWARYWTTNLPFMWLAMKQLVKG